VSGVVPRGRSPGATPSRLHRGLGHGEDGSPLVNLDEADDAGVPRDGGGVHRRPVGHDGLPFLRRADEVGSVAHSVVEPVLDCVHDPPIMLAASLSRRQM